MTDSSTTLRLTVQAALEVGGVDAACELIASMEVQVKAKIAQLEARIAELEKRPS